MSRVCFVLFWDQVALRDKECHGCCTTFIDNDPKHISKKDPACFETQNPGHPRYHLARK